MCGFEREAIDPRGMCEGDRDGLALGGEGALDDLFLFMTRVGRVAGNEPVRVGEPGSLRA